MWIYYDCYDYFEFKGDSDTRERMVYSGNSICGCVGERTPNLKVHLQSYWEYALSMDKDVVRQRVSYKRTVFNNLRTTCESFRDFQLTTPDCVSQKCNWPTTMVTMERECSKWLFIDHLTMVGTQWHSGNALLVGLIMKTILFKCKSLKYLIVFMPFMCIKLELELEPTKPSKGDQHVTYWMGLSYVSYVKHRPLLM